VTVAPFVITGALEPNRPPWQRVRFLAGRSKRLGLLALAQALSRAGALGAYRRRAMKGAGVVLLYHRVVDDPRRLPDCSPSGIAIDSRSFDAQMAYIKRHYHLLSLAELVDRVSNGLPPGDTSCAVAFDDGWRDNYTHAFPVLRKHAVPFTVFLTTNFVNGGEWFWESRLEYAVGLIVQRQAERALSEGDERVVRETLASLGLSEVLGMTIPQLRRVIRTVVNTLRLRPSEDRDVVLAAVDRLLLLPSLAEPRQFMNWDEIREMAAAGVDFGAHTLSHVNLERCDVETARAEITGSRSAIERSLMRPCALFAYPFGKSSPAVRRLVAAAGFSGALTTEPGLVNARSDRLRLNRIDIHGSAAPNLPYFACRALHLFGVY